MNGKLLLEIEELNRTNKLLKEKILTIEEDLVTIEKEKKDLEHLLKTKRKEIDSKAESFKKAIIEQLKVEEDLKNQVKKLNQQVADTLYGCQNESKMFADSLQKVSYLERILSQTQ